MKTETYLAEKYNLDLSQMVIEIPNISRLDLPRWLCELDFKTGAEIGVYGGDYSKILTSINPQMRFWAIDSWIPYVGYNEMEDPEWHEILYAVSKRKLHYGIVKVVRKSSVEALSMFEDNTLDFVYIDANHESPYVDQDITEWHKKVRSGGIVAGHDYIRVKGLTYTIIDVLNRHLAANDIKNLFILGSREKVPGVVRERVRSWAYVK